MATTWREMFSEAQRALPKNSTRAQRAQATKDASARYRAMRHVEIGGDDVGERMEMDNPRSGELFKWGIIAVGAYLGYQWWQGQQMAKAAAVPFQPTQTPTTITQSQYPPAGTSSTGGSLF